MDAIGPRRRKDGVQGLVVCSVLREALAAWLIARERWIEGIHKAEGLLTCYKVHRARSRSLHLGLRDNQERESEKQGTQGTEL